uniref:Uncharacterized protein n=1 Tax=Favella ehrenbergii TaxID=182087 RepID=A0A7S3MTB4_9SPIT
MVNQSISDVLMQSLVGQFLNLKSCTRIDTQLFKCLIGILLECLPWEGLADLELAALVVEAEIFAGERPHIIVKNSHLLFLEEATSETFAATLRSQDDLSDVRGALGGLLWHILDQPFGTLLPFKFDRFCKLLLIFFEFFLLALGL